MNLENEEKKSFCLKKEKAIEIHNPKTVSQLLQEMAATGFQGRKLGEVADVWEQMEKDPDVTVIMGYSGSLSTTGQWKIINWLIENHFVDVLVSTGANISEDIVDAVGYGYWQGTHLANDGELLDTNVNRYYDIYGKESEYLKVMEMLSDFIQTLKPDHPYSTNLFLYECGKFLLKKNVRSIVAVAAENNVPVFCPAISDSPYGDAALIAKGKGFNLSIDTMKEFQEFMSIANEVKNVGVVYIGGGVPKDFIQLLAVSSPLRYNNLKLPNRHGGVHANTNESYYPHKYAIQITTDSPQWGGLSGCTFEEAISWGKISSKGKYVQCYCDATIALPIVTQALAERLKFKRSKPDLSFLFKE